MKVEEYWRQLSAGLKKSPEEKLKDAQANRLANKDDERKAGVGGEKAGSGPGDGKANRAASRGKRERVAKRSKRSKKTKPQKPAK